MIEMSCEACEKIVELSDEEFETRQNWMCDACWIVYTQSKQALALLSGSFSIIALN